ncbi:MAG: tRNA (5-methylaminomethyl-2-thiouridine)(34)-methyltransferase MnmD [Flavobacteriales bacterium]
MEMNGSSNSYPHPFRTRDGSYTLYVPELDETYHSENGAIGESEHVFIQRGFHAPFLKGKGKKTPLRIFELGFGTGLNALLTLREAEKSGRTVDYMTIEPFPLPNGCWEKIIPLTNEYARFKELHEAPWERWCSIGSHFRLLKRSLPLEALDDSAEADLLYYDAFGAQAQPEMWDSPNLDRALFQAGPGSVFVTYAAKGSMKRCLERNGWELEALAGALGKREMTRAIKKEA